MNRICPPTHLLDHIRFTAAMGDWQDSVSTHQLVRNLLSSPRIHGLKLYLVLLANHSHHSVVYSRSSSLVVTDSSTDTLLPLPLPLAPLLDESAFSSLELGYTASLDAQSNTICHHAVSLFAPRCRRFSRELLARLAAATCSNSASFGPGTDPSTQPQLSPTPARDCQACDCHRPALPATSVFVHRRSPAWTAETPIVKVRTCCIGVKHNS